MRWKIYAGDREYDREVTNGKCFGIVEADTKLEAESKGAALLVCDVSAGVWAVLLPEREIAHEDPAKFRLGFGLSPDSEEGEQWPGIWACEHPGCARCLFAFNAYVIFYENGDPV